MNDGYGMEAIRLQVVNGKLKMGVWPVGDTASRMAPGKWGGLYPVCHIINHGGGTERLCDRIEAVAQETYRRAPGGVTNKLRQALRNANRYLYLRNRALGDRKRLLAAMSCLAIRGTDTYACGAGPHAMFIVSRGGVRSSANPVQSSDLRAEEDLWDDRYELGRRAVLSDPRFSYRQALPGDLILIAAADDARGLQQVGDELAAIADKEGIREAAQHIERLVGKYTNFSALLMRMGSDTVALQEEARGTGLGAPMRLLSPYQVFATSRRAAKHSEAREHGKRLKRKSLAPSKEVRTSQNTTTASRRSASDLTARFGGWSSKTRQTAQRHSRQSLQRIVEMCRLLGFLVVSLVAGLLRGGLALRRSTWQLVRRIWGWTRQHRVFERLGRGCELALAAVWAGSKGLLIRILPERQSSTTTYGASARPMARAKLVGSRASRRSRAAMGALILVAVFVVLAASALRIKSRQEQADLETLIAQVQETMLLAQREESGEMRIALLLEARDMIGQAAATHADGMELSELSEQLEEQWDAATRVVTVHFGADQMLSIGEGAPRRILTHEDQMYILNTEGHQLYRYPLDQEGKPLTNQEPWIWELQGEADAVSARRIVDMEWVDAGNGRLTPALLMLTVEGSILELNSAGIARDVSVSDVLRWQNARAIKTYHGNLYVLDPGRENIIKYIPTGDDYEYPPVDYFQGAQDIPWANVVDMAIDGSVYLLLSNGSIMKFAAGEPEAFTQEGLYPPLEQPVAIFASSDSASVFVAEPAQARIVEFDAGGQFIRQLRAANDGQNPFEDLETFRVDLGHDRLFVGTAAGLYSASLPSTRQGLQH